MKPRLSSSSWAGVRWVMKSPRVVTTRVFLSTRSAYSTSDTGTRYDAPSRSSSRSARTAPRASMARRRAGPNRWAIWDFRIK